jgi:uncharacterized protein (DUF433 family)
MRKPSSAGDYEKTMQLKPKIKARDAINDIRAGMTDAELMEKYDLSAKGLQSLFLKLLEAKAITRNELHQRRAIYQDTAVIQQIEPRDMVEDIRSGMTDAELMEKYALSAEGLRRIFQTLTEEGTIDPEDLYGTPGSKHDTVFVEDSRQAARHFLAVTVDVYESERPEIRGILSDITEKGIAIAGIEARVGETTTFVIPAENFVGVDPIEFEARCRWATKEKDTGEWFAGFQIAKISPKCLEDLKGLIQSASLFG